MIFFYKIHLSLQNLMGLIDVFKFFLHIVITKLPLKGKRIKIGQGIF